MILSTEGIFGGYNHYDENGDRVGSSWPGLVPGEIVHYNSDGERVGSSMPGLFCLHTDSDIYNTGDFDGDEQFDDWGDMF